MQVVFTPWTDEIKKLNSRWVSNFFFHAFFYSEIPLESLSPSRRREAPCEGTNSPRLFTPGETKALAESKVHPLSSSNIAGVGDQPWAVNSIYIYIWNDNSERKVKPTKKHDISIRHCLRHQLFKNFHTVLKITYI
jgi:hypothetical protein